MAIGINDSLESFIQQCVAQYDSSIDTSSGSSFDRLVTSKIVRRMGPDPTDTNAAQIIIDRINAYDSNISTEVGSGIRDLVVNVLDYILEPFRRVTRTLLLRGSWSNVEYLTEEEADTLADRIFVSRDQGAYSYGTLRLKFASPRDVSVTPVNIIRSGTLRFIPSRVQTISMSRMLTQTSGSYYYMDIEIMSEKQGSEYNLEKGTINSIDGVTGCIGVEQTTRTTGGRARQSNVQLKEAAENAITVRNLLTERSLTTVLPDADHFPSIGKMLVVGRSDAAMERDLILGPASISGIPQGVKGTALPDIIGGGYVHVGGFTDVWIAPTYLSGTDVEESIDVLNIVDEGVLVFSSLSGEVNPATADTLLDERSFFNELDGAYLPVQVGDQVIVQGIYDPVDDNQHKLFTVLTVNDTSLQLDAAISAEYLSPISYEVRRIVSDFVHISPDSLVSEDEDGDPRLDGSGDPYLPAPGRSADVEAYTATRNIGSNNISLPFYYISSIEVLDNVTQQPTGNFIPEADPIVFYISERVSLSSTDPLVMIRALFRYPTQFHNLETTRYYTLDTSMYFSPVKLTCVDGGGAAEPVDDGDLDLTTNRIHVVYPGYDPAYSSYADREVQRGDYIKYTTLSGSILYSVVTAVVEAFPDYDYVLADDIIPIAENGNFVFMQGSAVADMTADQDELGFYYTEFLTECSSSTPGDIGTAVACPSTSFSSQGWRVFPRLEGYSFSTLEEPILQISNEFTAGDETFELPTDTLSVRISYLANTLIPEVQDFLDTDEERVPAEDILARLMPPARVHLGIHYEHDSVTNNPTESAAVDALEDVINEATDPINATALSNVIEELDSDEVVYPFYTIVEYEGKSRSGKSAHGRLLGFRGTNGFILPDGVSPAVESMYRMAQFIPGVIVATDDAE